MTRFGAENGERLLRRSFGVVERVDYPNSLHFSAEEVENLLQYLRFKFRFLNEWPESEPELFEAGLQDLRARVLGRGEISLAKDDAAFWCAEPFGMPASRHAGAEHTGAIGGNGVSRKKPDLSQVPDLS
jgi:hypothetical protein